VTDPLADPYKTLQVDSEAEDEVIGAAYRRLARKYHPDASGGSDPGAATRMAALNAAFELIGDPVRRAAFDRDRALREALSRRASDAPPAATAPPSAGSPGPRPPETVSRDWTSGRSSVGGGYDASMYRPDGEGAAGPPPGDPSGSVLTFGRYVGWSLGEIARTGSFEDAGSLTRAQRVFFRLNLGEWWSEKMRAAAAMGMSHHMALQAEKGWEALAPEYQRVLSLYGVDSAKWDVVRASAQKQIDGRAYIAPDTISDPQIADQIQTYLNDRTGFFQLEPDAKTRAIMLQGTQPGTFLGEFMRFLTQFKSFTGAYLQKIFGRELYGRGYEGTNPFGALKAGNGEALGIANIVLWSTLFGYGSMVAKDLVKGKTPRLPDGNASNDGKIFVAALAQGGGMGLMGDFMFGDANRFGGGMLSSLAGPTAGAANDIVNLYTSMRDDAIAGNLKAGKVGADALRVALNNTPFVNLFYTRLALDYLLFYRMQEWMNPGYLSRMEQKVRTQNNQEFLLPPSSVIR